MKDLLCTEPSPAPHGGEIRQRLVTCGKLEKEMAQIYTRALGNSTTSGSLWQRLHLEWRNFYGDTNCPFISYLGRRQGSSLGPGTCRFADCWAKLSGFSSPSKASREKARVPGQSWSRVCSHLCGLHFPGHTPAALDHGNLQKGDRAYEMEIVQRNLETSHRYPPYFPLPRVPVFKKYRA